MQARTVVRGRTRGHRASAGRARAPSSRTRERSSPSSPCCSRTCGPSSRHARAIAPRRPVEPTAAAVCTTRSRLRAARRRRRHALDLGAFVVEVFSGWLAAAVQVGSASLTGPARTARAHFGRELYFENRIFRLAGARWWARARGTVTSALRWRRTASRAWPPPGAPRLAARAELRCAGNGVARRPYYARD